MKLPLLALAAAWLCEAASCAQTLSPRPAGAPPPFRRVTGKPAGFTPEMEVFLRKLGSAYQSADSYQDGGRVTLLQQAGRVKTTTEMPLETTFQRPNLLRLDAGQYVVACDGKSLVTTMEALKQFTTAAAPAKLEKKHLAGGPAGGGTEGGHPDLLDFLIRPGAVESLLAQVSQIGWKPDQRVGGATCRVLAYETIQGTRVTLWVEAERMVIRRVEAEATADDTGGPTSFTYELGTVELNRKLDVATFAFSPPAGYRRVREFAAGMEAFDEPTRGAAPDDTGLAGAHLLGQPAPAFAGKDLAGEAVSSTDVKGKVTLLFFWSLAGGEHCLRAIPIVQQVADGFGGRTDLAVLGVCPDAGDASVVRQLLERKEARFRTLLDAEMKMQTAFGLGGVPTFVLIGPTGEVAWAKLGAPPTLKEDLTREIKKLLPATTGK